MVDLTSGSGADALQAPLLRLEGIGKDFGGTPAVAGVDLELGAGSVHALVGENGAGKSTLGKIISGVIQPDRGKIRLDGRAVQFGSPRDALEHGICTISQEISLVPQLTVVENVFLGVEDRRFGVVDGRAMRRRFDELIASVGFSLDPEAVTASLRTGEQQLVEILRAIARKARLIVMDEPTAALSAAECERLHRVVGDLARSGTTIVYISHFLSEILELSDRLTVMRNGEVIRTSQTAVETPQRIVEAMLGRSFGAAFPERVPAPVDAPVVLEARGIASSSGVRDVSLTVRAGEIVGIGGLMGSGRTETLRALYGADPLTAGAIEMHGRPLRLRGPGDAVRAGIALVTESRQHDGLVMMWNCRQNVSLPHLRRISRGSVITRSHEARRASEVVKALDVRGNVDAPVQRMSGGNQQKVMFGRWLFERPQVLLIDEPTRGVDIGAKFEIYRLVNQLAADGVAVVFVSSDVEELLGLAHVVHVMHRSTLAATIPAERATEHSIMQAAFGLNREEVPV